MAKFKYKVADSAGKVWLQTVEADNSSDAAIKLRENRLTILKLVTQGESSWLEKVRDFRFSGKKFDVCEFTGKLVPLLQAHVQLSRALAIIYGGSDDEAEKEVVAGLQRGLQEGKKFSELLRNSGKFPLAYVSLTEAGEESGELTGVLEEVYRFLKEGKETRDFLVTSSIYPTILLAVTFLVIMVVFVFFLPYFANIFTDMGRELPGPTKALLGVSDLILDYWWLWVMSISGAVWYLRKVMHDPEKSLVLEGWVFKLPVVGRLRNAAQMSSFFRTLAILFQSNVQLLTSIRIATGAVSSELVRRSFEHLPGELRSGGTLSAGLKKSVFVPAEAVQLVEVGEESGEVGRMLSRIAERQEAALKIAIKRLLALFEPAVIIVLALVILVVVLTIFMTILEMNDF